MSVVPKLFVFPPDVTEYELVRKLYSTEYKHGWNTNLDDDHFNIIYRAITGQRLETNNYYRARRDGEEAVNEKEHRFGFLQFVELRFSGKSHLEALHELRAYLLTHHYDSDTVIDDILNEDTKNEEQSNIGVWMMANDGGRRRSEWATLKQAVFDWKQIECGTDYVLNITDCAHIERLIVNLQKFRDFHFVVNAVNMKQFILGQIICDFDHLVAVHDLFSGDDTVHIQQYIANEVACDDSTDCVVVRQCRNRRRENEQGESAQNRGGGSAECAVLMETLCGVHCYLLHRTNELYRLSSQNEQSQSRFSSMVIAGGSADDQKDDEKETAPLSIDFGVSVLRWLPFGVEPLFQSLRDEMVQNKDSKLSQKDYDRMEMQCAAKIRNSDYTLNEMMGLKFYSDLSAFTASLRRAHWTTAPLAVRRRYYHWARSIYLAALRHAVPIRSDNQKVASWLYHGLSLLFRMDQESPTYFGPFSTTLSRSVSDRFSEQKGLRLDIKSGYGDAMRRCLGINMKVISCFNHEQEVLLVDQPIPIQQTKTWT